jgi:hypothetical protein
MLRQGVAMMKHAALFTLISLALTCPVIAKPYHGHHAHHYATRKSHHDHQYAERNSRHDRQYAEHRSRHDHQYVERDSRHAEHYTARKSHDSDRYASHASHSGITCEMVRAYVAKVGLGQAIAMAKSAGISALDEQRARQCLANKI